MVTSIPALMLADPVPVEQARIVYDVAGVRYAQTNLQLYEQLAGRPEEDRRRVRDAYELATRHFAGHYRGCGKPFVAHLVGTASILAHQGAAVSLVVAGVLHACYAQGRFRFGRRGPTAGNRRRVRDAIGTEAEELIARYTAYDWKRLPDGVAAEDRPVIWMRVANELDECLDRGLRYVGPRKRRQVAKGIPALVATARTLDLTELAGELEAALAANEGGFDSLAADRDWSYRIR